MYKQMPSALEERVLNALRLLIERNGPNRNIDTAFAAIKARSPILVRRIEIAFDAGTARVPRCADNLTEEDHQQLRGVLREFTAWAYADESNES